MRDIRKSEGYFDRFLKLKNQSIDTRINKIELGSIAIDRLSIVKKTVFFSRVELNIAMYSTGYNVEECKNNFSKWINSIDDYLDRDNLLFRLDGTMLPQFLDYDYIVWIYALACIYGVSEVSANKLKKLLEQCKVQDFLLDFFVNHLNPNHKLNDSESYQFGFEPKKTLREITKSNEEPNKIAELLKIYIEKDWYKQHSESGWHNSHIGQHETYFGYWSFETAAVVLIKGLDDSSFRDCPYYPKDLVDFARSKM